MTLLLFIVNTLLFAVAVAGAGSRRVVYYRVIDNDNRKLYHVDTWFQLDNDTNLRLAALIAANDYWYVRGGCNSQWPIQFILYTHGGKREIGKFYIGSQLETIPFARMFITSTHAQPPQLQRRTDWPKRLLEYLLKFVNLK